MQKKKISRNKNNNHNSNNNDLKDKQNHKFEKKLYTRFLNTSTTHKSV